ncbi:hypothetical protein CTEN210_01118 [Chaetoceros tenuissimus]|uniref:Phytanoyl-CoA dioxygenase n=1 Tax=Chaetoceros tenuissimus TaxID=426638 RepID=A0AAD3GZS6_9STRA|nr:hypothetical protein CTEN210_01118 [Chaetoceros tenuissimus]
MLIRNLSLILSLISISSTSAFTPSSSPALTLKTTQNALTSTLKVSPSDAASELLYQEQENILINRGIFEQELISNNVSELQPTKVKVRGAGSAGGFSSKSTKKSKGITQPEGKVYSQHLKEQGVVRIDNILKASTAKKLRKYVYELREISTKEVEDENNSITSLDRFANVLLKTNRCDLTLPLGQANTDALIDALAEAILDSPVGSTIAATFGEDAVLHELSTLISDKGSQRQNVHPDTPYLEHHPDPVLYTCFIALQDVELDMGPTTWYPNTHTKEAHEVFKAGGEGKDDLLANTPAVLGTLKKGSCAIFDSRCLHCGTSNQSAKDMSRALFYFSFKCPKVGNPGNPASIRREIGGAMLSLKDIANDLESRRKKNGLPLLDQIGKRLK